MEEMVEGPATILFAVRVDEGSADLGCQECKKRGCVTITKGIVYDRMAMLLREMLTLSMLADRFKLARNMSAANLSSQTRDMASS